tara:strand:+ start:834 stop:1019 length:186 start_codon:yes stop_codon:yes gene_type:complete
MVLRLKFRLENPDRGWVYEVYEENIWYYRYPEDYPNPEPTLREKIEAILTLDPLEDNEHVY